MGNGMFLGKSVEKNLPDRMLGLYHGKKMLTLTYISLTKAEFFCIQYTLKTPSQVFFESLKK